MPWIAALAALASVHAAPPEAPTWEDLTPWRTWVVVENVTPPTRWFVADGVGGLRQRCEVGVPDGGGPPLVLCGPALRRDDLRGPVGSDEKRAAKAATAALASSLGVSKREVAAAGLEHLGHFARVSFREIVPTSATEAAGERPAWSWRGHWDVDLDGGRVVRAVAATDVERTAVCADGLHAGCEKPPVLAPYKPPAGWEGMIVTTDAAAHVPNVGDAQEALEAAVRRVAAGAASPAVLRSDADGLLPEGYAPGLRFDLLLQHADGSGYVAVDVPLTSAMARTALSLPIPELGVALGITVDLPGETLEVAIRPPGARYVAHTTSLACAPVRDEGDVALDAACTLGWEGEWLTWREPSTGRTISVQLADEATPVFVPTTAPSVRPVDPEDDGR